MKNNKNGNNHNTPKETLNMKNNNSRSNNLDTPKGELSVKNIPNQNWSLERIETCVRAQLKVNLRSAWTIGKAIAVGKAKFAAKGAAKGEWESWALQLANPLSMPTLYRYMKLAEALPEIVLDDMEITEAYRILEITKEPKGENKTKQQKSEKTKPYKSRELVSVETGNLPSPTHSELPELVQAISENVERLAKGTKRDRLKSWKELPEEKRAEVQAALVAAKDALAAFLQELPANPSKASKGKNAG